MRSFETLLFLIAMLLGRGELGAQQTYCYPLRSDSLHTSYRDNIRALASDPDSSWTAAGVAMGFPRVSASSIVLVQNETICQSAQQAFAANIPGNPFIAPSGKVYVFQVGSGYYFVADPDYRMSKDFAYEFLFTSSWSLVKRIGH